MSVKVSSTVAFLTVCTVCLCLVNPDFDWYDSAELIQAAYLLDSTHPPGHPLFVMLAQIASWLPFGSVGFRVGLLSIVSMAGAIVLALRLLPQSMHFVSAAGFAIVLLLHPTVLLQAIRPEVYGLATLTTFLIFYLMCTTRDESHRSEDMKRFYLVCLVFGLSLANHHFMALLVGPLVAAGFLRRWLQSQAKLSFLFWSLFFSMSGLALYLFLPLRASSPFVDGMAWGQPNTLANLFHFLRGVDYQVALYLPWKDLDSVWQAVKSLRIEWLLLGVVGLYLLHRLQRGRYIGVLLISVVLFAGALINYFNPENPDQLGYLAPLSLLLGVGVIGAAFRGVTSFRYATLGVLLAYALFFAWKSPHPVNRSNAYLSDAFAFDIEAYAPYGAVALVSSDHLLFPLTYRQSVWGMRRDLVYLSPHLYDARWYREYIARRYPKLKQEVDNGRIFPDATQVVLAEFADDVHSRYLYGEAKKTKKSKTLFKASELSVWRGMFRWPETASDHESTGRPLLADREYRLHPRRYRMTGDKVLMLRNRLRADFVERVGANLVEAIGVVAPHFNLPHQQDHREHLKLPTLMLPPHQRQRPVFIADRGEELVNLTTLYLRQQDWLSAEMAANMALAEGQPSGVIFLANMAVQRGDIEAAQQRLESIPKNMAERWFGLGVIAFHLKKWDLAEQHLRRGLQIHAGHEAASIYLARVEFERGNPQNAIAVIERALAEKPSDTLEAELVRLQSKTQN